MTKRRLVASALAWVCLGVVAARADQLAPRDVWQQATSAVDSGDLEAATRAGNQLIDVGKQYGIKNFPQYAQSAAALARQSVKRGNRLAEDWGNKFADQLDPNDSAVAFSKADEASQERNWARAVPAAFRGFTDVFKKYRTRLLSRSDFIIVALAAIALTAIVFAIALFVRYGRSMAHDFREILGRRIHGGSVTVLAFALLFLPLFLWLGPMWLLLYWFVIFFAYAGAIERVLIIVLALVIAALPILLDLNAHWIAGVDGPVVLSAIATEEQSYYPEALHRLQDVVNVAPNSAILHLLLGNLQLQDGNESEAASEYRKSLDLRDTAGAHVNLGNLHFLDNDYAAAITEYSRAEELDPHMAIAFYNHSIASGETYHFDDQAKELDQAKKIDRSQIERIMSSQSGLKVVMYRPPISEAWDTSARISRSGAARALFGNYSVFDPAVSARNPMTVAGFLAAIFAPLIFFKRRKHGVAGSCIKCGRTFCPRCKSARESATYCTQCIHIYLKRDGVSVATKRTKLEEVGEHQSGMLRRNKLIGTFLPGSAQLLEGRTIAGIVGLFVFFFSVCLALLVGRLAPVLAPGELAKMVVRVLAVVIAVVTWLLMTMPVYRRRVAA